VLPPPTPHCLARLAPPGQARCGKLPRLSPTARIGGAEAKADPSLRSSKSPNTLSSCQLFFHNSTRYRSRGIELRIHDGDLCNNGIVLAGGPDGCDHWWNEGNRASCSCVPGGMRGRYNFDTGVLPLPISPKSPKDKGTSAN